MATVKEIFEKLDGWAPFRTQMSFDNSGFLVGHENGEVTDVLVALDVTQDVVDEAVARGCQLVVAHHPVIFEPVRALTDTNPTGRVLLTMAEKGIAAICAHTNLDAAQGGVNDCLAEKLGLTDTCLLEQDGVDEAGRPYGIGRVGEAHESGMAPADYADYVKKQLGAAGVRFVDAGKPVRKVAVGGGSCGSMMGLAIKAGCDTFVTGDVKYNMFLDAKDLGLNLMDAGHYATENVVCPTIADFLAAEFPEVRVSISKNHAEVYQQA